MNPNIDLPVSHCLPEIVAALADATPVVLKAPPGAGKTTGVPPAMLSAGMASAGQILLIQPRRLAARTAASRIAHLVGSRVGDKIGYHVRFDHQESPESDLVAMTTGILLRRLTSDPLLEGVSAVLLDEFHERSLEADLALGMLQRIRTTLRPELKLMVMSATLDPDPIVEFLGDGVGIVSEGRAFPVDVRYTRQLSRDPVEQQIADLLPSALRVTAGHLLVFLPGVGEIRRTKRKIESFCRAEDAEVLELFGDLPPRDQDRVLADSDRRKVILATNVAETSITIPGVTGVIDSGLARVMRFDAKVGLPKLQLEPISQASALQRTGRAGRTEPGICWRLWPAVSHRSRQERNTPEIERADFSGAALTLAAWGEKETFAFPWLTPPPDIAVETANRLLTRLDAIDDKGSLTETGRQMLALPLHPRIARLMVAAAELGVTEDAAYAAALLTERDPFRGGQCGPAGGRARKKRPVPFLQSTPRAAPREKVPDTYFPAHCDVVVRIERLKAALAGDYSMSDAEATRNIVRVARQLRQTIDSASKDIDKNIRVAAHDELLMRCLVAAYPDRVARRRGPGSDQGLMVGGRGVRLDRGSSVRTGELFLCIDVDSKGSEAQVRLASAIEPMWLDQRLMRETDECFFNPTLQAVVARRRCYFDDLLLSESPISCEPSPEVAAMLADHARQNRETLFPAKEKDIASFIERVRFVTAQVPESGLTPLDDDAIDEILIQLAQTRTSIEQLQAAPWLDHLRGRYDYAQLKLIEQHAPARITVPSGNSFPISYTRGKPPVLAVRIQEIYGWQQTPRVAGGKAAIQLHLLGPNGRPQQITDDLANFWGTTYLQVRKELKRRYPKHHWPDDPTTASATRNGLKPKSERRG